MLKNYFVVILLLSLNSIISGCHFWEIATAPTSEGQAVRQQIHDETKNILPEPWGEIVGTIIAGGLGTVAVIKGKQANKFTNIASTLIDAVEKTSATEVKKTVAALAQDRGIADDVHVMVKEITEKKS